MLKRITALLLVLAMTAVLFAACGKKSGTPGIEFAHPDYDKDFSALRTAGRQEAAYEYKLFFLPDQDGTSQPYVGDPMPYYEDGVYYMY